LGRDKRAAAGQCTKTVTPMDPPLRVLHLEDARLSFDSEAVRLELRDNGKGFVADFVNRGGIGLIGMKERAEQIGATLAVTSEPHAGTTITAVSRYQEPVAT
jgi:signal transduction histidine kinase